MSNPSLVSLENSIDKAFEHYQDTVSDNEDISKRLNILTFASAIPLLVYALFTVLLSLTYLYQLLSFFIILINPSSILSALLQGIGLILAAPFLIFLLRPFIQKAYNKPFLELSEKNYHDFFSVIDKLSSTLHIDPIKKVYVSTDVVVDVYYKSIKDYKNKVLSLEVGLPLLTNVSSLELLSFISRECSFYSESKNSQYYLILRSIRSWCYRIAYNEDPWLLKIEAIGEKLTLLRFLFIPVYFASSFTNKVFQLFLNIVKALSGSVLDKMNYKADSYQAHLLGSDELNQLLKKLVRIDQAYHSALEKILSEGNAPANMSSLISSVYDQTTIQKEQFIEMTLSEFFSSWHMLPPPSSRTREITKLAIDSNITFSQPISFLFENIEDISTAVTTLFYKQHGIQGKVENENKGDSRKKHEQQPVVMAKNEEILRKFSSGLYRRDIVWDTAEVDKFSKLDESKITPFLNKVVVSIRHSLPEFNRCIELLSDHQKNMSQYHFYHWLIKDGSGKRPQIEVIENLKSTIDGFNTKYKDSIPTYRKFYGIRVVAGIALGRNHQAHSRALMLLKMLAKLSELQNTVADSKIKCGTLEQLIERREQGDTFHQKTISRLTRMILKTVEKTESVIAHFPSSLLEPHITVDINANKLQLEQLNGADYERLVIRRFYELVRYFEAYNTAISAKIALFVEMVERKQKIESVVTVVLKDKVVTSK
ncbi:hypothetical protein [Agarilytica rhodophyticola]|uniref:hypothetical protein n=1 Tax=Agarilytica rhodophyticola TaxID=1737490 RepID=UPI000B343330|nr:hypothetical protein [Agarilytica rhodophyticola]